MILRPATPDDAVACAAILRDWIEETPWFPNLHPASADEPYVLRQIQTQQVMVVGRGAPLGFLSREDDWIHCLYVARAHRGRGLGKSLLDAAKAQSRHLRLWTFQANTRAQAFYRREGFVEGARTEGNNEEGLPDIEFTWTAGGA